jgi:two-component system nitrate/nitrite response regulator NarL
MPEARAPGHPVTMSQALRSDIRVVVADDHAPFRTRLAAAMTAAGMEVVGEAGNGEEALDLVRLLDPDVAVLDQRMPPLSGTDVTRSLRRDGSRARVLILSGYCDAEIVLGALGAGANGFVAKDASRREILDAVVRCAAGARVVPPWVDQAGAARAMVA